MTIPYSSKSVSSLIKLQTSIKIQVVLKKRVYKEHKVQKGKNWQTFKKDSQIKLTKPENIFNENSYKTGNKIGKRSVYQENFWVLH